MVSPPYLRATEKIPCIFIQVENCHITNGLINEENDALRSAVELIGARVYDKANPVTHMA